MDVTPFDRLGKAHAGLVFGTGPAAGYRRERRLDMAQSMFHEQDIAESKRILYTASAFARANLVHLQEIGKSKALRAHVSRREKLTSYLFFVVLDGMGTVSFDGVSHCVKAGDCVFIDCQKPYSQSPDPDALWTLKWVHFYGPNMNGIYNKYLQRGGLSCFSSGHPEKYGKLLDNLYEIASSDLYIRDMKIYEKLISLLSLLMEENWSQSENNSAQGCYRQEIQSVKEYIDQHYAEKISLDELAERFYINKFYLTKIFKAQYGIPISTYIGQLRITRAKQLLRFTNLPIEEVGRQCGIADGNYFSRIFKKVEKVTPGQFRRMWTK